MEDATVTHPAKKRYYSDVYGHVAPQFEFTPTGKNKTDVWTCGLCQAAGSPKKWKPRNTSNFRKHLKNHHEAEFAVLTNGGTDGGAAPRVFTKHDQEEAADLLKEWIVGDNFPFLVVDQDRFRKFCAKLNADFHVPSRKTLRDDIMERWSEIKLFARKKLQGELGNGQRVSLTTDAWTSAAQRGYVIVTLHYINPEWQMRSDTAGFVRVEYPHSGKRLAIHLLDTVSDFDTELIPRLWTITTDNATNNVTMISSINTTLRQRRAQSSTPQEPHHNVFQVRCAGHVSQLAVREGLKECPLVDTAIGDLRDVVKKIRDSPKLTEKFEAACKDVGDKYLKLKLDVDTRWNSTWMMVERLLQVQRGVTELMHRIQSEQTGHTDLTIDKKNNAKLIEAMFQTSTWACAQHFSDFLGPFQQATVLMSGSSYPTLSMVALVYRSLRSHIQATKVKVAGDTAQTSFVDAVDAKLQAYDQLTITARSRLRWRWILTTNVRSIG